MDAHGEGSLPYNSDLRLESLCRENIELSSPVQDSASPDDNSRTTVMVHFHNVTGMQPCPDLSPNQLALRIACGTEMTLIRKDVTELYRAFSLILLENLWGQNGIISIQLSKRNHDM
ncbi:hypothetical protein TNCV_4395431 [Trichonephila clavipes]|uniref:Uncharacterized protein n=1 Tax=Trichonephila clavipes TaxID=2585209 RepID=A0A8X6W4X3_TRICX|nr:hypothetical protein TNCV_4395431 [Trichonephila clavipes]